MERPATQRPACDPDDGPTLGAIDPDVVASIHVLPAKVIRPFLGGLGHRGASWTAAGEFHGRTVCDGDIMG